MALPITGPYLKGQDTPTVSWSRVGYRQAKPYTLVSSLKFTKGAITSSTDPVPNGAASFYTQNAATWAADFGNQFSDASNRCREQFSHSIQDQAALGVDLAEYHQSVQMIATAAQRIGKIATSIRKKDFGGLLKAVDPRGLQATKRHGPSWKKSFGDNFLEYHFGWAPLAADIHDAARVISQPLKNPGNPVSSSSSAGRLIYKNWQDPGGDFFRHEDWVATMSIRMGSRVKCTNPALHLASSLGLTNPLTIAWELIPFSFVVDWFANVGQFVGQLDEFAGLELVNAYVVSVAKATGSISSRNPANDPDTHGYTWSTLSVYRDPGIPSVSLNLKPLKLPSATRAVTAVSLLLQRLK